MSTRALTGIVIAVSVAVLIIYDIWAVVTAGNEATISVVILDLSHKYPIIPFAVGVICGHWFFRINRNETKLDKSQKP